MRIPKLKVLSAVSLILLLAGVFLPIPWEISKETKVRFVSRNGQPMPALKVGQNWECFGFSRSRGDDVATTDASGTVSFPGRYGYGCALARILGKSLSFVPLGHASYGFSFRIEFNLENSMRAVFNPPAFKPLKPDSGINLDSIRRSYWAEDSQGGQRVSVTWDNIETHDPIQITIDQKSGK